MKRRPSRSKAEANRKNARKSTGPKTAEGKQAVALNGIRHGLRSLKPVIPWLEREEDWAAHRKGLVEQIDPVGTLEKALADRIALGFWRLGRCAEAEPRILSAIREKRGRTALHNALVSEHLLLAGESAAEVFSRLVQERDRLVALSKLWESLVGKPSQAAVDADLANELIDSLCSQGSWESVETDFNETFAWPPQRQTDLRMMVDWLFDRLSSLPTSSLVECAELAKEAAHSATRRILRVEEASNQAMELAMFEVEASERMFRAESAIHRALQKDLHELQRLQAMRLGQPVATPVALDVTLDS